MDVKIGDILLMKKNHWCHKMNNCKGDMMDSTLIDKFRTTPISKDEQKQNIQLFFGARSKYLSLVKHS